MVGRDNKKRNNGGFTLMEVLVASAVFILAFLGILLSYIRCMELSEMSKNSSSAVAAAKSKIEEIKNTAFSQVLTGYNNVAFSPYGVNGRGISYVTVSNADLLVVTVSVSWQQRNGRVVGEDLDLDGQLDAGEDKNANSLLDSPVELVTYVYNK